MHIRAGDKTIYEFRRKIYTYKSVCDSICTWYICTTKYVLRNFSQKIPKKKNVFIRNFLAITPYQKAI